MRRLRAVIVLLTICVTATAQDIPYGNNPKAGHYLQVDDAKLYYEVYGEGPPLLLLHGDLYGYIGEFEKYFPLLTKHFTVIAPARRGHGKSELGHQPFTEELLAKDALAILHHEKFDRAAVVGFSGGGVTAYYLAAYFPGSVTTVVSMAGGLNSKGWSAEMKEERRKLTYDDFAKNAAGFVAERKKLMPEPDRFPELLERLKARWLADTFVEDEKAKAIQAPVLVVAGDHDDVAGLERSVSVYRTIPGSRLSVFPNSDHVALILRPDLFQAIVIPFLLDPKL